LTANTLFGFDDTELLDDPELLSPAGARRGNSKGQ